MFQLIHEHRYKPIPCCPLILIILNKLIKTSWPIKSNMSSFWYSFSISIIVNPDAMLIFRKLLIFKNVTFKFMLANQNIFEFMSTIQIRSSISQSKNVLLYLNSEHRSCIYEVNIDWQLLKKVVLVHNKKS